MVPSGSRETPAVTAAIAGRPERREHVPIHSGIVVAAVLAAALAAATVDAIVHLHVMKNQLGSVGQRLSALDEMSRKLDRLAPMQATLEEPA